MVSSDSHVRGASGWRVRRPAETLLPMKLRVIASYVSRLAFLIAVGLVALVVLRTREFFERSCSFRKAAN